MPPEPVTYRLAPTGRTPHETVERLLTSACPSCGADWARRGSVLPRGPGRCYLCSACGEIHEATRVDSQGQPVESVGWGLAHDRAARCTDRCTDAE